MQYLFKNMEKSVF